MDRIEISDAQVRRAEQRMQRRLAEAPAARNARFDGTNVVVTLRNGDVFAFAPNHAQGLENATAGDLAEIEVTPMGDGLHFPAIDADLYVPSLLQGNYGSVNWMRRHRQHD